MRRRAFASLMALLLAVSAVAGLMGTVAADHDENAPTLGHVFLPWVPNGAELGDQGPYYGGITVQNLEEDTAEVDIYVGRENGWNLQQTVDLAPRESITLSAASLGVPSPGGSVALEGWLQREETSDDDEVTQEAIAARIAAVTKNVSPTAGVTNTTSNHETVDGYSGLVTEDVIQAAMVDEAGRSLSAGTYVLPIVQTNNGWNTVIRVASFAVDGGLTNTSVTLYGSGTQGYAGESQVINRQLRPGEVASIDLSDHVDEGWVGSAFITSNADVAAVAERHKDVDDMLITNTSRPELPTDVDSATKYGALVFKEYNFWNTGISVANTDPNQHNSVTISYFGPTMNQVGQDTLTIPPRGQEYVYTPGSQDLGLSDGFVGSVVIQGTTELHAAIDQVKYFGDDPDVGQAMSYIADDNLAAAGQSLELPLAQKGNPTTGGGDTSGIQLFNPTGASAHLDIVFYGANGLPVAPTVVNNDANPMSITLGANQSYTLYTHQLSELASGFHGSVGIDVVSGEGQVIGVSNNVNYDVQGDGSTAFNMIRSEPRVATTFTVEPTDDDHLVGETHEISVEVRDQFGAVFEGAEVTAEVTDGPHAGRVLDPNPAITDGTGVAALSYVGDTNVGTDTIEVSVDGIEEPQTVTTTWDANITLAHADDVEDPAANHVDTNHAVIATVTDVNDEPIENVDVDFDVVSDAGNPNPTSDTVPTEADGTATFAYTNDTVSTDSITATITETGTTADETLTKDWFEWTISLAHGEGESPQNHIGTEHTVVATVDVEGNGPVDGVDVEFAVVDGPNSAEPAVTESTDADGNASFTYTGENFNTDTIRATISDDRSPEPGAFAEIEKDWYTVSVSVEPEESTNPYFDDETLATAEFLIVMQEIQDDPDIGLPLDHFLIEWSATDGDLEATFENLRVNGRIEEYQIDQLWSAIEDAGFNQHTFQAEANIQGSFTGDATVSLVQDNGTDQNTVLDEDHELETVDDVHNIAYDHTYTNEFGLSTDTFTVTVTIGDEVYEETGVKEWTEQPVDTDDTLSLIQESDINEPGETHLIGGALEDENDPAGPIEDALIVFEVTSDGFNDLTLAAFTGDDGFADTSYVRDDEGVDTITGTAYYFDDDGNLVVVEADEPLTKSWVEPDRSLTLTQEEDVNEVGATHTFTATLTEDGDPLDFTADDVEVSISRDGTDVDPISDLDIEVDGNVATISYTGPDAAATDVIDVTVTVDGDDVSAVQTLTKEWYSVEIGWRTGENTTNPYFGGEELFWFRVLTVLEAAEAQGIDLDTDAFIEALENDPVGSVRNALETFVPDELTQDEVNALVNAYVLAGVNQYQVEPEFTIQGNVAGEIGVERVHESNPENTISGPSSEFNGPTDTWLVWNYTNTTSGVGTDTIIAYVEIGDARYEDTITNEWTGQPVETEDTLTLVQESDTNELGETHLVGGLLEDESDPAAGIEGALVVFEVTSDDFDDELRFAASTDENGEVDVSYTRDTEGVETIAATAYYFDEDGNLVAVESADTLTKTWQAAPFAASFSGETLKAGNVRSGGYATITTKVSATDQFGNPIDVPEGTVVCWTATPQGNIDGTFDSDCVDVNTQTSWAQVKLRITGSTLQDLLVIAEINGEFDGGEVIVSII